MKIEVKITIPEGEYGCWRDFQAYGIERVMQVLKQDYENTTREMGISDAEVEVCTQKACEEE